MAPEAFALPHRRGHYNLREFHGFINRARLHGLPVHHLHAPAPAHDQSAAGLVARGIDAPSPAPGLHAPGPVPSLGAALGGAGYGPASLPVQPGVPVDVANGFRAPAPQPAPAPIPLPPGVRDGDHGLTSNGAVLPPQDPVSQQAPPVGLQPPTPTPHPGIIHYPGPPAGGFAPPPVNGLHPGVIAARMALNGYS